MSALTLILKALAYDDPTSTSNPTQTPVNWNRTLANVPVENAETRKQPVDPLGTVTVLDGSRSTLIDGTTAFSLAPSTIDANRYRITNTGGTAPGFRTDRALAVTGISLAVVVQTNLSVTVTAGSGTPFGAVQVGDIVFIPGLSTGDSASPFNSLNEGYWTTLSASTTVLTLARPAGDIFSGFSEAVTPASNAQFQAFSATGVQVGDTVEIAAGFATTAQHSYEVLGVNPKWIEFESTAPLGAQTGVLPGATGLLFYTAAKRFLFLETDQEIVVRLNGDTGNTNRLTPLIPGDEKFVAPFLKLGPVWKLVVVNRSSALATVLVASAE